MNPKRLMALPATALLKNAAGSDHIPILHMLREQQPCRVGPRPFKYETMWEREDSLFTTVSDRWSMQEGETVESMRAKLGDLAGDLSSWDRNTFGSVRKEIAQLKTLLQTLHAVLG